MNQSMQQLTMMKELWQARTPGVIDREQYRHSAVLVPLIEREGELEILFEVRSFSLHGQPGEVCFPGGRVEEGEPFLRAAIRETSEELMMDECQIEVLAPLDILETPGGVTVKPFLGVLREYRGTFSADEVDHVFSVPLAWFLEHEPEIYQATVHTVPNEDFPFELVPGGREYYWKKGRYDVLFYRTPNGRPELIWGMTAKILRSFATLYKDQISEH